MSELTADCTPKTTALPRSSGNSSTPGITLSQLTGSMTPQLVITAETPLAERKVTSGLWVQYIARLQAALTTSELTEEQKSFYSTTYVAEQR
eukprot:1193856-Prorocentrum_minimum.AAC.2